jgi:hypothetical protein
VGYLVMVVEPLDGGVNVVLCERVNGTIRKSLMTDQTELLEEISFIQEIADSYDFALFAYGVCCGLRYSTLTPKAIDFLCDSEDLFTTILDLSMKWDAKDGAVGVADFLNGEIQ